MIKHFSVFYVGQLDFEQYGAGSPAVEERSFTNEEIAQSYAMAERLAKHVDERDFYCMWMAEHHFQPEGYESIPNVILLGTYLATQTKQLKFGSAFNIVPNWHPLRLAEDYAMADILTKGRMLFGVGRGYQTREVETFGAPVIDAEANFELFQEQMEVILKAFNEDSFSHHGKRYTIPPRVPYRDQVVEEITMTPRPLRRPVEVWMPVASGKSMEYLIKMGFNGMVDRTGDHLLDRTIHKFRDTAAEHGRNLELGEDLQLGVGWYLAGSEEEARRRLQPYHDEFFKFSAPWGFVAYSDEQGNRWGTPPMPTRLPNMNESLEQRAWYAGTPAGFVDFLKVWEERYPGLEHVMLNWPFGQPTNEFLDQLSIFAEEVMPAFRS